MSVTVSALQRVKLPDGTYAVVLPITTSDEVFVDIDANKTLSTELGSIHVTIEVNKTSFIDDLMQVIEMSAAYFPKPIRLNHIFADDFTDIDNITLNSGVFTPGSVWM